MSDGYKEMAMSRDHWDAKRDAEIERLRGLLREVRTQVQCVCWYDYSDDDEDVQADIATLRRILPRIDAALGATVQPAAARITCSVCGKPYVRVETDYGPGEHADCRCLDEPADKSDVKP